MDIIQFGKFDETDFFVLCKVKKKCLQTKKL